MKTSEKIDQLIPALLKAQTEMGGSVTKDSKNPFFKSSYATLNAVLELTTPILNRHGIVLVQPPVVETTTGQVVETSLYHTSGQYMTSSMLVTVAKQNDPQAQGSGVTYARRYMLMSLLSLGAEDDDGEAAMGRGKSSAKTTEPSKTSLVTEPPAASSEPTKKSTFKKPATTTAAPASSGGWE